MAEEPPTKRKCLGADCSNDTGSLQCPKCLSLGIKDSFFCSQDCFKKNWVSALSRVSGKDCLLTATLTEHTQGNARPSHKYDALHPSTLLAADQHVETTFFNPFPNFHFTGPLRPVYPLSPRRKVPKSIPHPDYSEDGIPKYGRVRSTKIEQLDAKAQDGMRKVCRLAREVLDIAAAALRPGITTDEIDEIVHNACIERNVGAPTCPGTRS